MDYIELAAKCRNPVVRNALLANAVTGGSGGLSRRLVNIEIKTASRDAEAARRNHARICAEIRARGAEGDPKYVNPMIAEYAAISEAERRESEARQVANALRAFHDMLEG